MASHGGAFFTDDLGRYYPHLLRRLRQGGSTVSSRVGVCHEVVASQLVLSRPDRCVVDRDGFSEAFMDEEILQLLAGRHDNDRLRAVVPRAADLITPLTAYGPRVAGQLRDVEKELATNPTSRRAVVYVGREDDLLALQGDQAVMRADEMPCTMTWQFLVRNDSLHMLVTMRSCDAVWGLCYDVPSFVSVQMMLCKALDKYLGVYVHQAGSLHLYERHLDVEARPNPSSALSIDRLLRNGVAATQEACQRMMNG